jgi:hypothetical protein
MATLEASILLARRRAPAAVTDEAPSPREQDTAAARNAPAGAVQAPASPSR